MQIEREKGCGWGCGLVVLLLGGIALGAVLLGQYHARKAAAPFDAMKEQVRTCCAQCALPAKSATPYRRGKVLVVDSKTGGALGQTMQGLPKDIAASHPDEVGTIVCVGPERKRQEGVYTSGSPALRIYRYICLFDLSTNTSIYSGTIAGSAPPKVTNKKGGDSGSDPLHSAVPALIEAWPPK